LVSGIFVLKCEPISVSGNLSHVLEISAIRRLVIGCDLKAVVEQVVSLSLLVVFALKVTSSWFVE
jgi:hypothetical protein